MVASNPYHSPDAFLFDDGESENCAEYCGHIRIPRGWSSSREASAMRGAAPVCAGDRIVLRVGMLLKMVV